MPKPSNIKYVYPLVDGSAKIELPRALLAKKSLVVFNVESYRTDDALYEDQRAALTDLRILINDCVKENTGVVVLCSSSMKLSLEERFKDILGNSLYVHVTENTSNVKLVTD
jgi:hypothetical protein